MNEKPSELSSEISTVETEKFYDPTMKWHRASNSTDWGEGMLVADVALDKDSTITMYVHRDDVMKVFPVLARLGVASSPEAHMLANFIVETYDKAAKKNVEDNVPLPEGMEEWTGESLGANVYSAAKRILLDHRWALQSKEVPQFQSLPKDNLDA